MKETAYQWIDENEKKLIEWSDKVWDFAELGFRLFGFDLYSGVYPNGGTEIGMIDGSLADVTTPSAFEFNPVTRAIGPTAYSWFNPSPVLYDSGETADLLSHLVPETAGLEDGMAYYWGVRYQGDNGEWSPWSAPTVLVADALPPTVILKEPGHLETGVAINTVIRATFSEPIAAASLDAASFTLNGPAGAVAGAVGYAAGTASFTPSSDLSPNSTYTATLSISITDTVGKQLTSPEKPMPSRLGWKEEFPIGTPWMCPLISVQSPSLSVNRWTPPQFMKAASGSPIRREPSPAFGATMRRPGPPTSTRTHG